MTKNARFWTYLSYKGWVKITLRPGQELNWFVSEPTEEGFSAQAESWEHCGDYVQCHISSWGRDCDGRHGSDSEYTCDLDQLAAGGERIVSKEGDKPEVIQVPHWVHGERSQYDEFAESMGY